MKTKRDVQAIPPDKMVIIDNTDVVKRLNSEMEADLKQVFGHGIECLEYKVLVEPVKAVTKTAGGIVLPEQVIEKDQHAAMEGKICGMSPFAFSYEEWPVGAPKPKIGDTVVFARYSGITQKGNDGVEYRIMNDKDIVAVRRSA